MCESDGFIPDRIKHMWSHHHGDVIWQRAGLEPGGTYDDVSQYRLSSSLVILVLKILHNTSPVTFEFFAN